MEKGRPTTEDLAKVRAMLAVKKGAEALAVKPSTTGSSVVTPPAGPATLPPLPPPVSASNPATSASITSPVASDPAPAIPGEKGKEKRKEKTQEELEKEAEEEIKDSIDRLKLESILPPEFRNLGIAQQLKVVRDLKQRVVDLVKSEAQTRYSEDLKVEAQKHIGPVNLGKLAQLTTKVENIWRGIKTASKKEVELKKLETEIFGDLLTLKSKKTDKDGKTKEEWVVESDLKMLTMKMMPGKRKIGTKVSLNKEGNPEIEYLEDDDAKDFNKAANEFAALPYEWGQKEKTEIGIGRVSVSVGDKARYEKAKQAYEKEKEKLGSRIGVDVYQLDYAVKLNQLVNTHPQYERALGDFARTTNGLELIRKAGNLVSEENAQTTTRNVGIGILGAGARWSTRLVAGSKLFTTMLPSYLTAPTYIPAIGGMSFGTAALATSFAAPAIGWLTGYWRGNVRGRQNVAIQEKSARYGRAEKEKRSEEENIKLEKLEGELRELELNSRISAPNKKERKRKKELEKEIEAIRKTSLVGAVVSAEHLTERLQKLIHEIADPYKNLIDYTTLPDKKTGEKTTVEKRGEIKYSEDDVWQRRVAVLRTRIDHAKGKIERGEVDFGDKKESLQNQLKLVQALSEASIRCALLAENKEVQNNIRAMVDKVSSKIDSRTKKTQDAFISAQAWESAKMGAGFAAVGYVARFLYTDGFNIGLNDGEKIDFKIRELEERLKELEGEGTAYQRPGWFTETKVHAEDGNSKRAEGIQAIRKGLEELTKQGGEIQVRDTDLGNDIHEVERKNGNVEKFKVTTNQNGTKKWTILEKRSRDGKIETYFENGQTKNISVLEGGRNIIVRQYEPSGKEAQSRPPLENQTPTPSKPPTPNNPTTTQQSPKPATPAAPKAETPQTASGPGFWERIVKTTRGMFGQDSPDRQIINGGDKDLGSGVHKINRVNGSEEIYKVENGGKKWTLREKLLPDGSMQYFKDGQLELTVPKEKIEGLMSAGFQRTTNPEGKIIFTFTRRGWGIFKVDPKNYHYELTLEGGKIETGTIVKVEPSRFSYTADSPPEKETPKPPAASNLNKTKPSAFTSFSLELGKGDTPANLERVMTTIAANSMKLPTGGVVNEEFATKALNIGANLERLARGGDSIAGITQEEWEKAANFEEGKLVIKDSGKFNSILSSLVNRANVNWQAGKLAGASKYIGDISRNTWKDILHAKGLDPSTGITGHDEVTVDKIGVFAKHTHEIPAQVANASERTPNSVDKTGDDGEYSDYEKSQVYYDPDGTERHLGEQGRPLTEKEKEISYARQKVVNNMERQEMPVVRVANGIETRQYTDGTKEGYDLDKKLLFKGFPDGTGESYGKNGIIFRGFPKANVIETYDSNGKLIEVETINKPQIKIPLEGYTPQTRYQMPSVVEDDVLNLRPRPLPPMQKPPTDGLDDIRKNIDAQKILAAERATNTPSAKPQNAAERLATRIKNELSEQNIIKESKTTQIPTDFIGKNPSKLTPDKLIEAYQVYKGNIGYITRDDFGRGVWKGVRGMKMAELLGNKTNKNSLVDLVTQLRQESGLKPERRAFFLGKNETVEEYIKRAIQKLATKIGGLDKFKK